MRVPSHNLQVVVWEDAALPFATSREFVWCRCCAARPGIAVVATATQIGHETDPMAHVDDQLSAMQYAPPGTCLKR